MTQHTQTIVLIEPAYDDPEAMAEVRAMLQAYVDDRGLSLGFQKFEEELADLPGKYAPPGGAILLAKKEVSGETLGCVAVRPLRCEDDPTLKTCEMKRLFVFPNARGLQVGKKLAQAILIRAVDLGYHRMRLDTLATMEAANGLYKALGFQEIPPYYHNPYPEVVYYEKLL